MGVVSPDRVNITVGTLATSSLRWVQHEQTQLLIVICSRCTITSITCIDVGDHSHAQTLWACLGASENICPPVARTRLWAPPLGEMFKIEECELHQGRISLTRRPELVFSGLFDPAAGPAAAAVLLLVLLLLHDLLCLH